MIVFRRTLFLLIVYIFTIGSFVQSQVTTLISDSLVVLNLGPATLKTILTQTFYNGSQPFTASFQWNTSGYIFLTSESIYLGSNVVCMSGKTGNKLAADFYTGRVQITFNREDIDITAGVYSVSFKFTNFKNPFAARAFSGFQVYFTTSSSQTISNTNFNSQALTQEVTRSNQIQIAGNYYIDSTIDLTISFTSTVAVDKNIAAIQVNLGTGKAYSLQQINNDNGTLISSGNGIYILSSIFKYFTTVYASSKNINFQIQMVGFTYAQRVTFDVTIVENSSPTYPKMETVTFYFDILPLPITSSASVVIPSTSSNLVGDNSIYLIDFTLTKGFQQNYSLLIYYDSSTISIVDLSATKLYDTSGTTNVLIETTPVLNNVQSVISLTHSNYSSTSLLDKKKLRISLSVRNPLSLKSTLKFSIVSALAANQSNIFEMLDAQLSVTLQPNILTSLTFTPLNPTVGQLSVYNVKFGVKTTIPQGGFIQLTLPQDIDFPFYKVGGTSVGSLNTVEPVSSNISASATIRLDQFPCASTGCIAYIENAVQTNIAGGSTVEFKLNFIRNLFSTRPASMTVATYDSNNYMIDSRQAQFEMNTPNTFSFVQIKQETSVVGLKSYYDFNVQFNTTHYDGYLLFITYPIEIQPIIQNVSDLNCIGQSGLISDLRIPDQSCIVTNVNGVNKIQIKLTFLNSASPSRTISIRISSFTNYFLANKNFYFGLETVIKESAGNNQFNIFYVEKLLNDPTLMTTMTTNTFSALSITSSPGIMDQQNQISINISPNTIPQSSALTYYIKFYLSPLLNVNTGTCTGYFSPPSNTNFALCAFSGNTFSIPFTVNRFQTNFYSYQTLFFKQVLGSGTMKFVINKVNYPYNRNSQAYIKITTYSIDASNNIYPMDLQDAIVPLNCSGECQTCVSPGSSLCLSCYSGFYLDGQQCVSSCSTSKYPVLNGGVWTCEACINNCLTCQLDASSKYQCLTCITNYVKISYDTCSDSCLPGTFKNSANPPSCEACSTSCYECVDTNSKCTSCNTTATKKYLFNNKCIDTCPSGTYTNSLTGKCETCHTNCTKCTDYTVCQECQLAFKYLVNNFCYDNCPNTTVKNDLDQCVPCTNNCLTCKLTTDTCTTCKSGYYLIGTTCSDTCPSGQVGVSGQCVSCTSPCETCKNTQTSCSKCVQGKYLTGDSCVNATECPSETYGDNTTRTCIKCKNNCLTCSSETTCKQCDQTSTFNKYYNGQCLSSCPSGTYFDSSNNSCKSCQTGCLSCTSTTCFSCDLNSSNPILINGQCLSKCPTDKPIQTSTRCTACSSKCTLCENTIDYCTKCPSGMSVLNGDCYSNCPLGYVSSGGVCQTQGEAESSLIILPFFIGSVIVAMITAFYFYWNRDMLYFSNFIGIISIFEIGCWLFYIGVWAQFRNDYTEEQYPLGNALYAFLFGLLTYLVVNIVFFIYFNRVISQDTRFKTWQTQKYHNRVYRTFSYIGLFISFKINRLLYGRLCSLKYLSAEFNENATIFKPINVFSVISLLINNLPIFISACMTLNTISSNKKDTQLYINGIEVILMNIFMLILVFLDFHKPENYFTRNRVQKQNNRVYVDDSGFGMMGLNENQSIDFKHMMDNYHPFSKIKSPSSLDQSMLNTSKAINGSQTPYGGSNIFSKKKGKSKIYDENGNIIREEENDDDDDENLDEETKNLRKIQREQQLLQQSAIDIEKGLSNQTDKDKNKNNIDLDESMNQNHGATKNSEVGGAISSINQDQDLHKNNKLLSSLDSVSGSGQNGLNNNILQNKSDDSSGENGKLNNSSIQTNKQSSKLLSKDKANGKGDGESGDDGKQNKNNKRSDTQNSLGRGRSINSKSSPKNYSSSKGDLAGLAAGSSPAGKNLKSQKSSNSLKNDSPSRRNKSQQSQSDLNNINNQNQENEKISPSMRRSASAKKPKDKNEDGFMSGKECHHLLRVYERSTSQASKNKNGQQSPQSSAKQNLNSSLQASSRNPRDTIAGSKNKKQKNQKNNKDSENDYDNDDPNNYDEDGNYNPIPFSQNKQRTQQEISNPSSLFVSPETENSMLKQEGIQNESKKNQNQNSQVQLNNNKQQQQLSPDKMKENGQNIAQQQQSNKSKQNLNNFDNKGQILNDPNFIENSSNIVTSQIVDQDDEDDDNPLYNKQKNLNKNSQNNGNQNTSQIVKDKQSQLQNLENGSNIKQQQDNNGKKKKSFIGAEEEIDLEGDSENNSDNINELNKNDIKRKGKRNNDQDEVGDYFDESQGSIIQDTPSNYNEQNMRFAINQGIIDAHMKVKKTNDAIAIPIPALYQNTSEQQQSGDNNNLEKYKKKNSSKKLDDKGKKKSKKGIKQTKNGSNTIEYGEREQDIYQGNDNNFRTLDAGLSNRNLQFLQNTQSSTNSVTIGKQQLNQLDIRTLSPKIIRNAQQNNMNNYNSQSNISGEKSRQQQVSPSQNGQFIRFNYNDEELDDIVNRRLNQRNNRLESQTHNNFLKTGLQSPSSTIGGVESETLKKKGSIRKNISKSTKRSSKQIGYNQSEEDEDNQNNPYDVNFPAIENNNQEFSDFNSIDYIDQFASNSQYDPESFKLPTLPKGNNPKLADLEKIYLQRLESLPKNKQKSNQTTGLTRHKSLQKPRTYKNQLSLQDAGNMDLNFDKIEF